MQTYTHYKDSGIDWIGQIPEHWEVKPGFTVLKERKEKNKGMISNNVLSLSYGKIIEKPVEKLTGLVPENFETYQLVYKGDIIFRPTDLQNDKVSLRTGLSKFNGIITSAYINLQPINTEPKFLHYYLHTTDTNKVIYGLGSGLRQNISFLDFKRFSFVVPPIQEQEAIANFLDEKTAKIDALVQTKEQQIEKLKELRQAKIHQAVTKGLDANAPTKNSGVEWIGEIPAHWEMKRLKNVALINKNVLPETFSKFNEIEYVDIGSVNLVNGIEKTEKFLFKDAPSRARRIAKNNDTIISTVRTYLKAIDFIDNSKSEYIFSTGFAILEPAGISPKFLANSVRSDYFTDQVTYNSKGMSYPAINSTDLSCLWLSIPPIHEQEQIVAYLDEVTGKIDQAIAQKQQQITKLKEYKQSLINDVVTGKVKVC